MAAQPRETPSHDESQGLRERYLSQLLAHIERHKFYPQAARSRGMEETVKVSFVLLEKGGVDDLKVEGKHKLLRNAAREAMEKARPLPPPPPDVTCPLRVSFRMRFALR